MSTHNSTSSASPVQPQLPASSSVPSAKKKKTTKPKIKPGLPQQPSQAQFQPTPPTVAEVLANPGFAYLVNLMSWRMRVNYMMAISAQTSMMQIPDPIPPELTPQTPPPSPPPTIPEPPPRVRLHHIDEFFSQFPEFDYDPYAHPSSEFQRLSELKGWDWDEPPRDIPQTAWDTRHEFRTALVRQFNKTYGKDENRLEAWKKLCERLQYDPIPNTLKECRTLVKSAHVNLIDLLAIENTGRPVRKYPTELALSEYTLQTMKIFPRDHLEAGNLLKRFLRQIFNPPEGDFFQRNRARGVGYGRSQGIGYRTDLTTR